MKRTRSASASAPESKRRATRNWKCPKCPYRAPSTDAMDIHAQRVHDTFVCHNCEKLDCEGSRALRCRQIDCPDNCTYAAPTEAQIRRHAEARTLYGCRCPTDGGGECKCLAEDGMECEVEGCPKRFREIGQLWSHLQEVHDWDKCYECRENCTNHKNGLCEVCADQGWQCGTCWTVNGESTEEDRECSNVNCSTHVDSERWTCTRCKHVMLIEKDTFTKCRKCFEVRMFLCEGGNGCVQEFADPREHHKHLSGQHGFYPCAGCKQAVISPCSSTHYCDQCRFKDKNVVDDGQWTCPYHKTLHSALHVCFPCVDGLCANIVHTRMCPFTPALVSPDATSGPRAAWYEFECKDCPTKFKTNNKAHFERHKRWQCGKHTTSVQDRCKYVTKVTPPVEHLEDRFQFKHRCPLLEAHGDNYCNFATNDDHGWTRHLNHSHRDEKWKLPDPTEAKRTSFEWYNLLDCCDVNGDGWHDTGDADNVDTPYNRFHKDKITKAEFVRRHDMSSSLYGNNISSRSDDPTKTRTIF